MWFWLHLSPNPIFLCKWWLLLPFQNVKHFQVQFCLPTQLGRASLEKQWVSTECEKKDYSLIRSVLRFLFLLLIGIQAQNIGILCWYCEVMLLLILNRFSLERQLPWSGAFVKN
jgi:hypothetical protein